MSFSCLDVARAAGLQGQKTHGAETAYRCPRHDDSKPSLGINTNKDAWQCVPCGAKGKAWALAAFVANLDPGDKPAMTAWLRQRGLLNGHASRVEVATYPYDDERGVVLYEKVRTEPKGFYLRRPDGSTSLDGVRRVPYRLGPITAARPAVLYIPEGEKDVDRLVREGLQATTNDAGASKWLDTYTETLLAAGVRHVVILRDHDEPGHRHGEQVARSFHTRGVRVTLPFVVGLHDTTLPTKHGKDISDWLAAGHTVDELQAIVDQTPDWTPEGEPTTTEATGIPAHWQTYDLADLSSWQVEPLSPVIDGLIARGNLVYVAAQSQTGKSLLWAYTTRLLVQGGRLFGRFDVHPVDRLLYMVLEDPARRLQDRLLDTAHEFAHLPPLEAGRCVFQIAPSFDLTDPALWTWFERQIADGGWQVVILDTYQKATPGLSSFDDEQQSVILHKLANLTRQYGITLVIIDHVRKQQTGKRSGAELNLDDIKGSGGKAQNADVVILMDRTPDRKQIRFIAFSKDFDTPVRILVAVAPRGSTEPKFAYAGDLDALGSRAKDLAEARKQRVLAGMQPGTRYSVADLITHAGVSARTLQTYLRQLVEDGSIDMTGRGKATRYWIRATNREGKILPCANDDN